MVSKIPIIRVRHLPGCGKSLCYLSHGPNRGRAMRATSSLEIHISNHADSDHTRPNAGDTLGEFPGIHRHRRRLSRPVHRHMTSTIGTSRRIDVSTTRSNRLELLKTRSATLKASVFRLSSSTMLITGLTRALPAPRNPPFPLTSNRARCDTVSGSPTRTPPIISIRSTRCAMRSESGSPMALAETTGTTMLASFGMRGSESLGALIQRLRAPSALTRVTSKRVSACTWEMRIGSTPANRPCFSDGQAKAIFSSSSTPAK